MLNAQIILDPVLISADSLAKRPVTLSKPWKYSKGDDSTWAFKSFDDSTWDTLRPRLEWEKYPTEIWNGIGWFRREIKIDSSLFNKSVALSMSHFGASEIYFNGEQIATYGKVSAIPDSEKVYQPQSIPIAINFTIDTNYVLAVRYSNHASIEDPEWTDSWYGQHGFTLRINEINDEVKNQILNGKMNFGVNFAIGGIFFSLAILYFLLHLFYSKRKENLYYALFSFSLALLFFSSKLGELVFTKIIWAIIFQTISITGIAIAFLGYLGFIYSIFYKKIPKQIWFFLFGTVLIGIMFFINPLREYINYALPIYIFLATIEGLRSIIIAIKNKKEHAWVIGTGVMVFVFLIITIFVINLFNLRPPEIYILILFIVGLFGLPGSMSVYLARSIASTNKKLEQQIIEIKELSDKELLAQQKNSELVLETEREKAEKNEAVLQAKAAELQAKASEAERRILEAENERKTRELEEARSLQLSLLPKTIPSPPNLEISVYMETATEVGGDYYDFYEDPSGELTILIGDATGHGLNAGTVVTATKSLFNSHGPNPDIVDTFFKMSSSLKQMNFRLLSMCLMLLKIKNNELRLSSAGMPPALIYRSDSQTVDEFIIRGMPLGTANSFPYELQKTTIKSGDTILLMSDGFPELFNQSKEMFGYKNVQSEFLKCGNESPELIIEYLKNKMKEWSSNRVPDDDVTFVVIKAK
jgi:serine phosphatase RsbU (regulator of sigma subunit)